MKKDYLLGILFFSALWGFSEAGLGGIFYKYSVPHASVILTAIGFLILTFAKVYLPQRNSAIHIGLIAMFYKFLNLPFFACHLLAIALLGITYDFIYSKIKNKALVGFFATYLGYLLFGLSITFVFRYHYWFKPGFPKLIRYIMISAPAASLVNAIVVPFSFKLAKASRENLINPFEFKSKIATASVSFITACLWIIGITVTF